MKKRWTLLVTRIEGGDIVELVLGDPRSRSNSGSDSTQVTCDHYWGRGAPSSLSKQPCSSVAAACAHTLKDYSGSLDSESRLGYINKVSQCFNTYKIRRASKAISVVQIIISVVLLIVCTVTWWFWRIPHVLQLCLICNLLNFFCRGQT